MLEQPGIPPMISLVLLWLDKFRPTVADATRLPKNQNFTSTDKIIISNAITMCK